MTRAGGVLVVFLCAGCLNHGEAPPWKDPNARISIFDEAVEDASGARMQMGGSPTTRTPLRPEIGK